MFKKIFFIIISLVVFSIHATTFETITGKEIKAEKIIIQEFFFYGCPHCQHLNSDLKEWLKNYKHKDKIIIEKVPVQFSSISYDAARHFYTAKIMEVEPQFTEVFYYHAVKLNKKIDDALAIEIMSRFADEVMIKKNINSHFINQKTEAAKKLERDYKIEVMPTIVINGKYKFDPSLVGGRENLIKTLEILIERELNNK